MLLRTIYDESLAQAAYLIGCQRTGEAVIIDPERDVDRYTDLAHAHGLRIVAATETHIHADFLSGCRQLAETTGCRLYLSGEGGPDWQYEWLGGRRDGTPYEHTIVRDTDTFAVGNITFRVIHTPGHTPEHICFLVTDGATGTGEPMGIATGDFVFVGDLGRPDLLETAAGVAGASKASAHDLARSAREILKMPDHLQIWPGHGAGSACGKALGAVPQSTIGYERRTNHLLGLASDEAEFVRDVLSGQPEPPMYFAHEDAQPRRPAGARPAPRAARALNAGAIASTDWGTRVAIDTRPWRAFRRAHLPGSIWCPIGPSFAGFAGSFVEPDAGIVLVAEPGLIDQAVRHCVRIGLDAIVGHVRPGDLEEHVAAGGVHASIDEMSPDEYRRSRADTTLALLDVRRATEHNAGSIPGAVNIAHTRLARHLDRVDRDQRVVVQCRSGVRSASAASYLARQGYRVVNLAGGILAWEDAGGEVQRPETQSAPST